MLWEVLWPLAFGFLLSAMIQTVVSKRAVAGALGKPDLKGFVLACGFGAASSSCSYAAVAVGRALFRRGASLVNAIIFEFASTNLVFELGLVLLILLGWQFVAAEFAGGLLMAVILWILFKVTLRQRMVDEARRQAERGVFGSTHEAHGEMDMSITDGRFLSRVFSPRAFTAISHTFFMDLKALYVDIGLGFLVGGAFQLLVLAPTNHHVAVFETQPSWNYTSFLDVAFLVLMAVLAWRFVTTGGIEMLRAHARRPEAGAKLVRDPVCGMSVDPATSDEKVEYMGASYYFCSAGCRSTFEKDPARYTSQVVQVEHAGHLGDSRVMAARPGGKMELHPSAIDPVCGMSVDPGHAEYRSFQKGETYYFCSAGCKEAFDKDPGKYINRRKTGAAG